MARPDALVPGNCYFSVHFYDDNLVLPMIDTLVYVGHETTENDGTLWLFREPDSPHDEAAPAPEPSVLVGVSDDELHAIVDIVGLTQVLREIAVDHPLTPAASASPAAASAGDFGTLSTEIATFLNDADCLSLTMTIRFTDDGLSLGRRNGGYALGFFAHPRRDPEEASRILALLASMDLRPQVDYLCDRGRTRVLEFAIPGECESMAYLCRRVLTEVYSMRRGDVLIYHPLRKADVPHRP